MQGLLLLNKPSGITSFGAVAAVRKISGEKRVGHTGTLDPMATGVLPVLIGRATALSSYMLDADKRYRATAVLGITTDTEDITGSVIKQSEVNVTRGALENALCRFTGRQMQKPPMFSALKKNGVPLYKLARKGIEAEVASREIEVFSIELSEFKENTFSFDVYVSKGTYIRSLVRDIGDYLGCGAVLTSLERTYAAGIDISDCVGLEDLTADSIGEYLINEESAVAYLPELQVTEKQATRFCNGGQLGFERLKGISPTDGELFRVKSGGLFLGVGYADCERAQIGIKCIINYPKVIENE